MAIEFQPDLLLLDVMMPGMSGPETLAKLRALPTTKSVPVIFMTAKVQESEISEYLALGAIGVISKQRSTELIGDELDRCPSRESTLSLRYKPPL